MVTERPESRRPGVQHLEHREGVLSFARIATTLLHAPLLWVTMLLYPTASESWGVHARYALLGTRSAGGGRRPGDRLGDVPIGPPLALAASYGPGNGTRKVSPARQRRAMGTIEQALLDGDDAPTDLRPSLANRTITPSPLNVVNVHCSVFKAQERGKARAGARFVGELRPYERSRCDEHVMGNRTEVVTQRCRARPTGGSHGRTTDACAQRRGGAKRRPRQSRRPSAAKRIIRVEVPKDTGPKEDGTGILRVFGLLKPRKSFSERHILLDGASGTPFKLLRPFYELYKSLGLDSFHF